MCRINGASCNANVLESDNIFNKIIIFVRLVLFYIGVNSDMQSGWRFGDSAHHIIHTRKTVTPIMHTSG